MNWIRTSERLPATDMSGESEYVLAYRGRRCIPQIVKYSDGTDAKRGWWTQSFGHIPFHTGRGSRRRLTFTHWCEIEYPE